MNEVFVTKSFEETQRLGEDLSKGLKGGEVIALYGDLGAGKTTFVQGLAKGLGVKNRIISPTFIIMRNYSIVIPNLPVSSSLSLRAEGLSEAEGFRDLRFYHIDLYRVQSPDDIKGLGIEEIINDSQNILAIEWAEKMGELLPKERIEIKFEYLGEEKRKIIISR